MGIGYSAHLEAAVAISMLLLGSFGTLLLKSLSQRAAVTSNMGSLPQILQKERPHLFLDHGFLQSHLSCLKLVLILGQLKRPEQENWGKA